MPVDERAQVGLDDEVGAVALEGLDRAPARPSPTRAFSTARIDLLVMSGFCSEPERANSFSMIFCVSTNHVCSWPVPMMCCRVPSVSKPGKSGGGSRRPVASSQRDEGPGRIRMPCRGQIGSQFSIPSV